MAVFSSANATEISEFYWEIPNVNTSTRSTSTAWTIVLIWSLAMLPTVLVVYVFYIYIVYSGPGMENDVLVSSLVTFLFVQPLGVIVAMASARCSSSMLPLDYEFLNRFSQPLGTVPSNLYSMASCGCWLINGCEHSIDSSPAILYVVSGSLCGSENLLSRRQLWSLIAVESCFFAGCQVVVFANFCFLTTLMDDGDDFKRVWPFMVPGLLVPFAWYALFKAALSQIFPAPDYPMSLVEFVTPAEEMT